ncbi:putative methyltransferase type 11 [Clostridium botulinum C str. Eklund]|nr:putative methyltransferase type 11 [Clostridium botulinum C str. Eklund]NEZ48433.1 class I SAM-dependent methyltransferase [Clostridium botulinum]
MNTDIQNKWEKLHEQSRFRPKYPSEEIVQFIFRNFKRDGKEKVLDLGCGAGRHVYFMANEGIDVYGCDISREGINYTQELLKRNNLSASLNVASIDKLPYEDNFFDGLISCGVLYYCKIEQIKKAILEIHRVLKEGSKGLIIVRNTNDYRFKNGEEIEKNTFMINEDDFTKCAFNENGMIMHFFQRDELVDLFSKFTEVSIDEITHTHSNGKYMDSNYEIIVEK